MHLCMLDYVGHDKIDPALSVQGVCKKLSNLKQNYFAHGRNYAYTPDELFDQFCALSVSLPDNVKTWSHH